MIIPYAWIFIFLFQPLSPHINAWSFWERELYFSRSYIMVDVIGRSLSRDHGALTHHSHDIQFKYIWESTVSLFITLIPFYCSVCHKKNAQYSPKGGQVLQGGAVVVCNWRHTSSCQAMRSGSSQVAKWS